MKFFFITNIITNIQYSYSDQCDYNQTREQNITIDKIIKYFDRIILIQFMIDPNFEKFILCRAYMISDIHNMNNINN